MKKQVTFCFSYCMCIDLQQHVGVTYYSEPFMTIIVFQMCLFVALAVEEVISLYDQQRD